MAEYGAHITITSRNRPSIFDVVAQDSLMTTLQPAIRHGLMIRVLHYIGYGDRPVAEGCEASCNVAAESNPAKYGWCLRYHNELFLIFNFIIQNHYLSNYGSSFSESFYDLKRVPLKASENRRPLCLTRTIWRRSLMALVGFPYLQNRLDKLYNDTREKESDGLLSPKLWISTLQSLFLKLWPLCHSTWEGLILLYYTRYLIGKSKFHSPLLPLCGVKLANLTDDDYEAVEEITERMLTFRNIRTFQHLGQWLMERIGSSLMNSLEVTAFFLQFLDWFYSSGNTMRSPYSTHIPPPPSPEMSVGAKSNSLKTGECPLCCKSRKQDTALSVSGYVFCYSCILPYVKREGKCPVTGYPASSSQLVRIYLNA